MKNVPLWNIYLCMNTHPAAVQSMLTEARCTSHFIFASCSINNFKTSVSHCPIYTEVWCFPWLACFCIANTWKKRDLMTTTNTNFWSFFLLGYWNHTTNNYFSMGTFSCRFFTESQKYCHAYFILIVIKNHLSLCHS